MKSFLFLVLAIVCETFATSMLNASRQFTKLMPSVCTVVGYCASFYLLSHALKTMPVGVVYAIWSALGIVLVTLVGMLAFGQKPDLPAMLGMALIIAGVCVIQLFSKMEAH